MPLDQSVMDSQEFKDTLAEAVAAATAPLKTSITNLEGTNAALKTEKQSVSSQFNDFKQQFDGIDVKAMQEKLAAVDNDETRALLAQGEFDKVYEKQLATINADHKAQLAAASKSSDEMQELVNTLQTTMVSNIREGGIARAFVDKQADKTQLRSAQLLARDTVAYKGEQVQLVSVGNDGAVTFRHCKTGEVLQNAAGNFNAGDWLDHLAEEKELPLYAKPNGHGSNNVTEGNPKGFVKSKMSSAEKQNFKKEHGIPAFDALPYS